MKPRFAGWLDEELLHDEVLWNLLDEPRRLGVLVLTEDTPAGGTGQHELLTRAGDADVAQPALFFEFSLVVS